MSTMMLDRKDHPKSHELLKTVIAAQKIEQEKPLDQGLYLERGTLLDDDVLEPSLDDYDDLIAVADDGDWGE